MAGGEPSYGAAWVAYLKVRDALEAGTGLQSDGRLVGSASAPDPLQHRLFRIQPGQGRFLGKARPGDVVLIEETITIHLSHDMVPDAHDPSFQLASEDFLRAVAVLLTDKGLSGVHQPRGLAKTFSISGHHIRQSIALAIQYAFPLPASE